MRNPRIAVTGASSEQLAQIKILLGEKDIDLIDLADNEEVDAVVTADWVLEQKLPELADMPDPVMLEECCTDRSYDNGVQHWRDGARGRKGKIKYRRN